MPFSLVGDNLFNGFALPIFRALETHFEIVNLHLQLVGKFQLGIYNIYYILNFIELSLKLNIPFYIACFD